MTDETPNTEQSRVAADCPNKRLVMRHVAWGCRTCNKIDWVDDDDARAKPEHVPYRGVDIGTCKGEMIKLYSE